MDRRKCGEGLESWREHEGRKGTGPTPSRAAHTRVRTRSRTMPGTACSPKFKYLLGDYTVDMFFSLNRQADPTGQGSYVCILVDDRVKREETGEGPSVPQGRRRGAGTPQCACSPHLTVLGRVKATRLSLTERSMSHRQESQGHAGMRGSNLQSYGRGEVFRTGKLGQASHSEKNKAAATFRLA